MKNGSLVVLTWLRKYDLEGTSVGLPKLKCKKKRIEKEKPLKTCKNCGEILRGVTYA